MWICDRLLGFVNNVHAYVSYYINPSHETFVINLSVTNLFCSISPSSIARIVTPSKTMNFLYENKKNISIKLKSV